MPRSGTGFPTERPTSALTARELAALARRLSLRVTDIEVRNRLIAYAMELEAGPAASDAQPGKAEPLRMATGPIIQEATPRPAPPLVATVFSPRTDRLIREARQAISRLAALRQWQMPVRRPFHTGPPPV